MIRGSGSLKIQAGSRPGVDSGGGSTSSYASTVLATPGLISYWRLGEASGTSAADSKGTNTGTYTGSCTLGQPGALPGDPDTAVGLDGSTAYISVPDAANLRFTGDFTLEAWIKPTDYANWNMIVTKDSSFNPRPYEWRLDQTTGKPNILVDSVTSLSGTTSPATGVWSHIAVTMSGTTYTHYLNGATNGSGTFGGTRATDAATALLIGARANFAGGEKFKGSPDEVAVYNVALSGATIASHYNAR